MADQQAHIRWEESGAFGSILGYVGTIEPWLFQIWTSRAVEKWQLQCVLPGMQDERPEAYTTGLLKSAAEVLLSEFVSGLGAVFPESGDQTAVTAKASPAPEGEK